MLIDNPMIDDLSPIKNDGRKGGANKNVSEIRFNPPPPNTVNDISGISGVHDQSSVSFIKEIRAINNDPTPRNKPPLPKRPTKPPRGQMDKGVSKRGSKSHRRPDPQDQMGADDSDDSDNQIIDKEKRKKNLAGGAQLNRYNS